MPTAPCRGALEHADGAMPRGFDGSDCSIENLSTAAFWRLETGTGPSAFAVGNVPRCHQKVLGQFPENAFEGTTASLVQVTPSQRPVVAFFLFVAAEVVGVAIPE